MSFTTHDVREAWLLLPMRPQRICPFFSFLPSLAIKLQALLDMIIVLNNSQSVAFVTRPNAPFSAAQKHKSEHLCYFGYPDTTYSPGTCMPKSTRRPHI